MDRVRVIQGQNSFKFVDGVSRMKLMIIYELPVSTALRVPLLVGKDINKSKV